MGQIYSKCCTKSDDPKPVIANAAYNKSSLEYHHTQDIIPENLPDRKINKIKHANR